MFVAGHGRVFQQVLGVFGMPAVGFWAKRRGQPAPKLERGDRAANRKKRKWQGIRRKRLGGEGGARDRALTHGGLDWEWQVRVVAGLSN
jgi:hypothetical protein